MPEKETKFSSKIKSTGIFNLSSFYKFCYEWLTEEANLTIVEDKYKEKLDGEVKAIEIEWTGKRKVTDYFQFEVKVSFKITNMSQIEIDRGNGVKEKSNKGAVETKVKGNLVRDYEGKFDPSAFKKFLRAIYEKWVIPSRIRQYEDKLVEDCGNFLNQAKAYLDLEGKKE